MHLFPCDQDNSTHDRRNKCYYPRNNDYLKLYPLLELCSRLSVKGFSE